MTRYPLTRRTGFTLIELLIVVAIIAILAAIAVPNFLEAQTRSKVSRVKADMRSMATGIEAYLVDNNRLPRTYRTTAHTRKQINAALTTPIAYLTSVFYDPFNTKEKPPVAPAPTDDPRGNGVFVWWGSTPGIKDGGNYIGQLEIARNPDLPPGSTFPADTFFLYHQEFYSVTSKAYQNGSAWLVFSLGPDLKYAVLNQTVSDTDNKYPSPFVDYDPTNGTISFGDIIRFKG